MAIKPVVVTLSLLARLESTTRRANRGLSTYMVWRAEIDGLKGPWETSEKEAVLSALVTVGGDNLSAPRREIEVDDVIYTGA